MAKLGYARVSTNQQSLKIQVERLISEGVENDPDFLFTDKASGKNDHRPGLQSMISKARRGDHIIITKLDRLGRSTVDMVKIVEDFQNRGIHVRFLDDGISTDGPMGKMVMTILSAVAQAERERIMERTKEGREKAIADGVRMGRKAVITGDKLDAIITDINAGELSKVEIAKKHSISRRKVYDIIEDQTPA